MTVRPVGKRSGTMTNENHELSMDQLESVNGGGSMDGISNLIAVTQMKANNANDAAMSGGRQSVYIGRPASHFWH
jgi:hypothetical protein